MQKEYVITISLEVQTEDDSDNLQAVQDTRETLVRVAEMAGAQFRESMVTSQVEPFDI